MLATNKYVLIGAGVAGLVAIYLARKAVAAVPKVLDAVNPLNYDNVFNQGATSLYQGITGSNGTIGTDFYDATHGGWLDPTSSSNPAAASVDAIGGAISGDKNWSLGTAIYDWTH